MVSARVYACISLTLSLFPTYDHHSFAHLTRSFPKLYWYHYHSNWEALDALRYLRSQGSVIHSWP